jgi:hypothetical protein
MQVNIVLLMLIPAIRDRIFSYDFVSVGESDISIPSVELQDKFGSMDNVLQSITEFHLGVLDFQPTYILYDVYFHENVVNIYYYTFLPMDTEITNGNLISLEEIRHLATYQKVVNKIIR